MRLRSLLVMLSLILVQLVIGGVRDFSLKRYGLDQDFEGIFIYDIIQDDDGFLWIASDAGLYKFDGLKMINLSETDTTMDELVTATTISQDGHLHLGYFSGGISVVEHGRYRKLLESGELTSKIVKMRTRDDGSIWALTQNGVLVTIVGDEISFKPIEILSEMVSKDFFFHQDWLYIATSEGLVRFHVEGDEFAISGFVLGVEALSVNALYEDPTSDQVLWVGTGDGLYRLDHSTDVTAEKLEPIPGTEHFDIATIAKDHLETLWVGTSFHGLIELDLLNNQVKKITYFNKSNGFPSDQISKTYIDRENEVWIGTFGNGLVQLNRAYFHHYELNRTKRIKYIHALEQINEDLFYLGTEGGLIKAYNYPTQDSLNFERVNLGLDVSITSMYRMEDVLWIGTKEKGLFTYDLNSEKFTKIFFEQFVGTHAIRYITRGAEGNIWISVAGHGVYLITQSGEIVEQHNTRTGFFHNEVFSILHDNSDNVWFASYGAGLALLPKGEEIQYLTRDGIFPARDINSIKQDETGKIWIATSGSGAYGYDGNEFTRYAKEDGLLSDFCSAIEVDEAGQIWVGHRKGLSLIQPEYNLIRRFNHPSELGETESVINAVLKDSKGNIWFGNPYGVTKVILPHIQHTIEERNTHILDVRLFYEQEDLLNYSDQEKLDNILPNDMVFPYDENHLTFDYVAVNLKNPEAIYYKYQLDGFDENWSPMTTNNVATYNNLDPGRYTFKVKESDHADLWGNEFHEISFRVKGPYWRSWWFYLIQIGIIVSLLVLTGYVSKRLQSVFWIRIMVYISLFMAFEYVHTEMEPYIEGLAGENAPIFEVVLNLCLALVLLPLELRLTRYFKKRRLQTTGS